MHPSSSFLQLWNPKAQIVGAEYWSPQDGHARMYTPAGKCVSQHCQVWDMQIAAGQYILTKPICETATILPDIFMGKGCIGIFSNNRFFRLEEVSHHQHSPLFLQTGTQIQIIQVDASHRFPFKYYNLVELFNTMYPLENNNTNPKGEFPGSSASCFSSFFVHALDCTLGIEVFPEEHIAFGRHTASVGEGVAGILVRSCTGISKCVCVCTARSGCNVHRI